jgi:hypothetical protein
MLQQKTPLKAKTGLKTYKPLQAKTGLRAKQSLRDSYAAKVKAGIKTPKKSYQKAYKPSVKYFSVFTDDLDTCLITGDSKATEAAIEIHHIFGAANKTASERYGFIMPVRADWHTLASYSLHQDMSLNIYWKRKCQDYWLEHYGTREEFINVFGKWW